MSWLKEKLVRLRSQEIKEKAEKAEKAEEEQRAWAEKEERALKEEIEKTRRLIEIGNEWVRPTLELVNKVYLENEGEIYVFLDKEGKTEGFRPPYTILLSSPSCSKEDPEEKFEYFSSADVSLRLTWGYRSGDGYSSGNRLEISLNRAQKVELTGAKEWPRIELGLNDRNFQQKLERSIYKILATGACYWYSHVEEHDRDR